MDRDTGTTLVGHAHLAQSIRDILTTPIGTRVMRRGYGFDFDLIDMPITPLTMIDVVAGAATALRTWEPRLRVRRITVDDADADGSAILTIAGDVVTGAAPGAEREAEFVVTLRPAHGACP